MDISWGELESSGPIRAELAHGMLGKGGHSVGLHKHTAVHFCQLPGPGALHLFEKISTEEAIMGRSEPGLRGPDSSYEDVPLPDPRGKRCCRSHLDSGLRDPSHLQGGNISLETESWHCTTPFLPRMTCFLLLPPFQSLTWLLLFLLAYMNSSLASSASCALWSFTVPGNTAAFLSQGLPQMAMHTVPGV